MEMEKVIYPELSYQIMGILFEIHNELGCRYQEKYYQRAIALAFDKVKLQYKKELKVDLIYDNKTIGKYFLDFLVEGKIILEIKTVPSLNKKDINQVLAYLKANNLKLGIIVNFRTPKIEWMRVLNADINN